MFVYNRVLSDSEIAQLATNIDHRNIQIATDTSGNTTAVWEDLRNSSTTYQNRFDTTGSMSTGRYAAPVVSLIDGRVLIAGGETSGPADLSSGEIFDPVTQTFSTVSNNMANARYMATAAVLNGGRALIIGGANGSTAYSSTSIYDPYTNTFSAGANMSSQHYSGASEKLQNGKVLVIGGCTTPDGATGACSSGYLSSSELYDPATSTWTATGNMFYVRSYPQAVSLPNGEVLVAGGTNGSTAYSSTEIYNPVTGTWRIGPSMSEGRYLFALKQVTDTQLLAVAGANMSADLSTTELYDIAANTWKTNGSINTTNKGGYLTNSFTKLGNGNFLLVGGYRTQDISNPASSALLYDPITNIWSPVANNMSIAKALFNSAPLPTGKVLLPAGMATGTSATATSNIYSPVTYDIYAQKYDKDGTKLWNSGTDIRVNSDDGNRVTSSGPPNYNHLNPSVAIDSSGNAIIAWEEQRDGVFNSSIWTQKLASSNGAKQWPTGTKDSFTQVSSKLTYARSGLEREGSIATALNNGKVIITGTATSNKGLSMSEIYDPTTGTFSVGPKMVRRRQYHSATTLLNGQVLIAGGGSSAADASNAEIYDPITNTFSQTGFMPVMKARHAAVLLKNGKVFVSGGVAPTGTTSQTTTEIFDPTTGTWVTGPGMAYARQNHTMTVMQNGNVLIIGDSALGTGYTAAEVFDPVANTITKVPGGHEGKAWNGSVLLNNGKVFSVGPSSTFVSTAELFNPATNTWEYAANPNISRQNVELFLLPNGKVIAAGGWDNNTSSATSNAEIYDPATNTWSSTGNNFKGNRIYPNAAYLPSENKLLFINGGDGLGGDTIGSTTGELLAVTSDMPVSEYDYKHQEGFKRAYFGSINTVFYKNPKVVIDSNGDAIIAWQDDKDEKIDFQGLSHEYDANAYLQYGKNNGSSASFINNGTNPDILSPSIIISAQKICNQASCGDAGTTSGERQWGNDQNDFNKNNAQDVPLAAVRNSQNPSIIADTTNTILSYDSDAGTATDMSSTPLPDTKNKKIYTQKYNSSGNSVWTNGWSATSSNLATIRRTFTATTLNSGYVLVTGGRDNSAGHYSSGEIFNPLTQTWTTTTNNMAASRYDHRATLLPSGAVLITGGAGAAYYSSAFLFNQSGSSGSFTATTGNMTRARSAHSSTLLKNGNVLITGGSIDNTTYNSSSELYNPQTGTFSASGNLTLGTRVSHEAIRLSNGNVLVAGGYLSGGSIVTSTAEVYNPVTATWTPVGSMSNLRRNFTLTALRNGKILAVGGVDSAATPASSAELFDPLTNSWTSTGSLTLGGRSGHNATLLPNGKVLITGGSPTAGSTSSTEIYDPITGTFTQGSDTLAGRISMNSVALANGQVLAMSGLNSSSSELYSIEQPLSTKTNISTVNNPATTSNKTAGTNAGTSWTGTTNTASSDNSYAAYNNSSQDYLKLTNFGFTSSDVPTNATITGVTATIEGNAAAGAGSQTSSGPNSVVSTSDCTNDNGTGTAAWLTPTNCATSNNAYATVSVDGTTSNWLKAVNFGFSIPTSATVNGITVEVERKASATNNGAVDDVAARIVKGGLIQSTDATLLADWSTTESYVTYGGSSSLWGTTWTPSDINLSNFGFALSVTKTSSGGAAIVASVDHIRITVTYTTATGNTYNVCLTENGTSCAGTEKTSQTLNVSTDTTNTVGGASDVWGGSLTQADVTASTFGVMIRDANTDASALNFDQVQLKIDYTTPTDTQTAGAYSNTYSQNPDLVKDSDGNIQAVWQSWRKDGLSTDKSGGAWRIATQKINNPASGSVTKQYPSTGADSWSSAATMQVGRSLFASTTLPNGKVLVSGGTSNGITYTSAAEIYDPYANTWSSAANMPGIMANHKLFTLKNGNVLAVPLMTGQSSYLYDPSANTWTTTGSLNTSRNSADSVMLNDGKVLVAGGCDTSCTTLYSSSELYNPATGTWTLTSGNIPFTIAKNKLIKATDDGVYSLGGCTSNTDCNSGYTFTNTVYKYTLSSQTWTTVGTMLTSQQNVRAIGLNSGKILIFGGEIYNGVSSIMDNDSQEIFDPALGTSENLGVPTLLISSGASVLPDGTVLGIAGQSSYIFDPQLKAYTNGPNLSSSRSTPTVITLKTGKVLVAGGLATISSAELYTPDPSEKLIAADDSSGNYNQTLPKIGADATNGTTYVAWNDMRLTSPSDTVSDSNIYMQRLSSSGNPTWPNGTNSNGTYNVRDVRVNNTRGSLDTTVQTRVAMAKSTFDNNNGDGTYPIQLAWTDTRDVSPASSIYGQSYDTRDRTMTTTDWTAYYYVTGSPSNANSISVQVGAAEADGETMSYTSAASTYTGDGTNGEKSTLFSNLPPSGETNLTHRRIIMKLTRLTGSMQIQYNGASSTADTRLSVGMVVPERSAVLGLLIPLLPGMVYAGRKKKLKVRYLYRDSGNNRNK